MRPALIIGLLVLAVSLPAMDRFSLTAGTGLPLMSDENLRQAYGPFPSLRFSLSVSLFGPLHFVSGLEFLSKEKESEQFSLGGSALIIRHSETRIQLQLLWRFPLSPRLEILGGGGICRFAHRDRTRVPEMPADVNTYLFGDNNPATMETSGAHWGPVFGLLARYRIGPMIIGQGGVNYSHANLAVAGEPSRLGGLTPFLELGLIF